MQVQIPVPDSMIGSLLGRGGQTLSELQLISQADIKISQRNEFIPGTTNRIVTIIGSQQSCETAHALINQKIQQLFQLSTQQQQQHGKLL